MYGIKDNSLNEPLNEIRITGINEIRIRLPELLMAAEGGKGPAQTKQSMKRFGNTIRQVSLPGLGTQSERTTWVGARRQKMPQVVMQSSIDIITKHSIK